MDTDTISFKSADTTDVIDARQILTEGYFLEFNDKTGTFVETPFLEQHVTDADISSDAVVTIDSTSDDSDIKMVYADTTDLSDVKDVKDVNDLKDVNDVKNVKDVKDTEDEKKTWVAEAEPVPPAKAEQKLPAMSPILFAAPAPSTNTTATKPKSAIQILYVKPFAFPRSTSHTTNVTISSPSISYATSLTPTNMKTEYFFETLNVSQLSSIRSTEAGTNDVNASGASTSTINSEPTKPVEHTVNLLNNNRIVIKSVKNTAATTTTTTTTTSPTKCNVDNDGAIEIQAKCHEIKHETKHSIESDTSKFVEGTLPQLDTDQLQDSHSEQSKCNISDNGITNTDDHKHELKQPQRMFDACKLNESAEHEPKITKIRREFKQLQKDVSESKILTEFIMDQNTNNRRPLLASGKQKHTPNTTVELHDGDSPCAESPAQAEGGQFAASLVGGTFSGKRYTRSRNTDFSAKQRKFLKGIQQVTRGTDDESDIVEDNDDTDVDFQMEQDAAAKHLLAAAEQRKSLAKQKPKLAAKQAWDKFCWKCHQIEANIYCSSCVRSYHDSCLKAKQMSADEMAKWQCPECIELHAAEQENVKKKTDVRHFNRLLKYAMNHILQDQNLEQFQYPVSKSLYPDYANVIIHPTNLNIIETSINNSEFVSSEAFLTEIKWIFHNCTIFFADNYKITRAVKALQKACKQEMTDIETCPQCYLNANIKPETWFTEVCDRPHLILWAKLKGFPLWPAKAMSVNAQTVDVRFFGEHDRANLPAKDCFLYSNGDPNPPTNKYKRNTIADCVKEVEVYINNIIAKFGSFHYAEMKTPFNPQTIEEHLFDMIPTLNGQGRRRTNSVRSDLTLRIIKTADNNLSVVKKGQSAKDSLQLKRTVDITGDKAVSRTPTPPQTQAHRRQTIDIRSKRVKVTNRYGTNSTDNLPMQMTRRKSVAVDLTGSKKPSSIAFKRRSIEIDNNPQNISAPARIPARENAAVHRATVGMATTRPIGNEKPQVGRKRKPNLNDGKSKSQDIIPTKVIRVEKLNETLEEKCENEANILRSVGLVKKVTPENKSAMPAKRNMQLCSVSLSRLDDLPKEQSPRSDEIDRNDRRSATKESHTSLTHRPLVDVKNEPVSDNEADVVIIPLKHSTPQMESDRRSKKRMNDEFSSSSDVRSENDEDDCLMIIGDEVPAKQIGAKRRETKAPDMRRNTVNIRDLTKWLNNEPMDKQQETKARKTFPKASYTAGASILKPISTNATNKTTTSPAVSMHSMVCIPMENIQGRLDVNYSSTQPPPLSIVSKSNATTSVLSKSHTVQSHQSNEPPPLAVNQSISNQVHVSSQSNVSSPSTPPTNSTLPILNGILTDELASAVTDTILGNPPTLTPRPARADNRFNTEAGPASRTLMENAHKMTDFFRSVIVDTLADLAGTQNAEAKVRLLELELEKERAGRVKDIAELKANSDRLLAEMKKSMEKERMRAINETRKQCEMERIRSVEDTKKKLWCANCGKEALFYCCWNTSYCNHTCQKRHWESHIVSCQQLESPQGSFSHPQMQRTAAKTTTVSSLAGPKPIVRMQSVTAAKQIFQKEPIIQQSARAATSARVISNALVPGLRNILPKNAVMPIVTTNQQLRQQTHGQSAKPSSNQCIQFINSVNNWANQQTKAQSLLHPNTFILTPQQMFANMQQAATSTSTVQSQKSTSNDTIIIP